MSWDNAVVTLDGVALAAELIAGGTMTITRAEISENVVDVAALTLQTSLLSPLDVPVTIAGMEKNGANLTVCVQIRNTNAIGTHSMRQMGIYAKTETTSEKLFAILQNEIGEDIPPASEYPYFLLEFNAIIAVSNAGNVSVTVDPASVVVTKEALDDALADKADKSEIPTSLPANGGNAATVNGHTVNADVPANAKFTDTTYTAATVAPKANGTAAVGTSAKYAREDHVHPAQTSVSGNAGTATKLQTARKINGVAFDGSSDITIKAEANGGNAATVNGHTVAKDVPADAKFTDTTYTAAAATPKANGTAAVGTSAKYAREDHVHPAQTSVSGNAGTATKLQTARKINGVAFDGSADITVTAVDSTARTAASNAQTTANTNATNITSLQNGKFDKTGGTISGDVRIKNSTNYGTKLNFGDGDYVYLHEDTDDHLVIHAGKGVLIDTTGDGLIIDGVKYPTQCLGNDTRFVYPPDNGVNVNNYKSETHVFLMNAQNTPTSHGFLDVSYFDGSYYDLSPGGVVRQRWTDWSTGDEWVRMYRAGTWQASWNKLSNN